MNRFEQKLAEHHLPLTRRPLECLQINVGRKCNQACRHCHVDAGPWRTEMIDEPTAHRIGEWIQRHRPPIVDLTGGAPELSEFFRYLVETARASGSRVIDRNNLTILEEPGYEDLPEYLAQHEVEIVASLPCYLPDNVTRQRGAGVYEKSIRALRRFNAVGYGTKLALHLVYNPVGPTLPGPQAELEAEYKEALHQQHGIVFHHLYTITNQPIARFAEDLRQQGRWDEYLALLANSFNQATVEGLMCRTTLSVDYRGRLYDCDFNQMLNLVSGNPFHEPGRARPRPRPRTVVKFEDEDEDEGRARSKVHGPNARPKLEVFAPHEPARPLSPFLSPAPSGGEGARRAGEGVVQGFNARIFSGNSLPDPRHHGRELFLWDITPEDLPGRKIATGAHCLACTAGGGSSCTGALEI